MTSASSPLALATIRVHLPQAILRGNVALRDEHVLLSRGIDVRNSVLIAPNGNRRGEPRRRTLRRKMNVAVDDRQCRLGSGTEPEDKAAAQCHDDRQQPNDSEEDQPRPATPAGAERGFGFHYWR